MVFSLVKFVFKKWFISVILGLCMYQPIHCQEVMTGGWGMFFFLILSLCHPEAVYRVSISYYACNWSKSLWWWWCDGGGLSLLQCSAQLKLNNFKSIMFIDKTSPIWVSATKPPCKRMCQRIYHIPLCLDQNYTSLPILFKRKLCSMT